MTPKHLPDVIAVEAKRLAEGRLRPGLLHVTVEHDNWCDMLKGKGPCNCNPTVREGKPPPTK